jgi:hypothetical protein
VSLCSIECAEKFLRGPDHHANANGEAHQDFIGELVEEMRWTQYR